MVRVDWLESISIHALRGEGDQRRSCTGWFRQNISIHALRGEGDAIALAALNSANISIHALRGEGDYCVCILPYIRMVFLSTPSAGRATLHQRKYS